MKGSYIALMIRNCFAPLDGPQRDGAVAEGSRDAMCADVTSSRLVQALPKGLSGSCVASLMPGPDASRTVLAYLACAAGWAGRLAEEPDKALGLAAVGVAVGAMARLIVSRL